MQNLSVHLVKQFQKRRFLRNQPIRNKNCLWWPCLLTNWAEMSNLYRGPPIDTSYQVSVHLPKRFQRRFFQKSTNQKKELSVSAMFVNGSGQNVHSLQRTFHKCFLPCFGSFYQAVSEKKIKKNQPIRNKSRLWRPYLLMDRDKMCNLQRTFHRCFLPSFSSLGKGVSKEKIKM